MTLEEAKEILNSIDIIDLKETHDVTDETYNEAIDTVLKALGEYEKVKGIINGTAIIWASNDKKYVREDKILKYYIPKEKVRELIKSYENDMELCDDTDMFEAVESDVYAYGIDRLKELLRE